MQLQICVTIFWVSGDVSTSSAADGRGGGMGRPGFTGTKPQLPHTRDIPMPPFHGNREEFCYVSSSLTV